ncbi:F-box protein At4g18380-like [Salvia miltiorrhiza]|uniref:F-box protein At4g18380-like n=1 Tax=Salvia miltiorrhiza TaxID=226208 RepID=UPI0025AB9A07|nr:F-box protein At4g18380-like [Salvia miltiorrhiza]
MVEQTIAITTDASSTTSAPPHIPILSLLQSLDQFFFQLMVKSRPKNEENDLDFYAYYVPNEILKNFQGICGLHLQLPCHGNQKQNPPKNGKNSTTLLKWKAEFGRELHNCVILGAKSWAEKDADESKENASRVMGTTS